MTAVMILLFLENYGLKEALEPPVAGAALLLLHLPALLLLLSGALLLIHRGARRHRRARVARRGAEALVRSPEA